MQLKIAGLAINDPLDEWLAYGRRRRTATSLRRYDFADRSHPDQLTADEATRSRDHRLPRHEQPRLGVRRGGTDRPLAVRSRRCTPAGRRPSGERRVVRPGGALYGHFLDLAPSGIRATEIHKVLHVKRPHLFPVMDDRLWRLYRQKATEAATALSVVRPGYERLYWAALREDLIDYENVQALEAGRKGLRLHDGVVGQMAGLSDLRLLDIVAWRLAA